MFEGLKLKDQLPKAIDWGSFCLTDGEALVDQLGATPRWMHGLTYMALTLNGDGCSIRAYRLNC